MLLVVMMIVAAAALAGSTIAFDRLLRYQYESHRERWNESGKPIGFFYIPDAARDWDRYSMGAAPVPRARQINGTRVQAEWFSATPLWARTDPRAMQLLFWYRAFAATGLGTFAVSGLGMLLYYWNA